MRICFLAVTISICGLTAWQCSQVWAANAMFVQRWLTEKAAWENGAMSSQLGYVRIGSLDSVARQQKTNPNHVALRVFSDVIPGYLRGRTFSHYSNSRWKSDRRRRSRWDRQKERLILKPLRQTPNGLRTPQRGHHTFVIRENHRRPLFRMEIWNDPQRGEIFFTPLKMTHLQGLGSFLALGRDGIVVDGLSTQTAYTAYIDTDLKSDPPDEKQKAELLQPLIDFDPRIVELAASVCGLETSDSDKIKAVCDFFQSNYLYSLNKPAASRQEDPLSHFLMERPAAHCEYFASGAITFLRMNGVPSRFVTGYVVTELESEYGDYWIARNRNAHAWAEAYDRDRSEWVIVEATPGITVPSHTTASDVDGEETDQSNGSLREIQFGQSWFDLSRLFTVLSSVGLFGIQLALAVICVVAIAFWAKGFKPRKEKKLPAEHVKCQKLLHRMDRTLVKRKFVRKSHETLHQFARRLTQSRVDDDWLARAATWLVIYAEMLYQDRLDAQTLTQRYP